MLNPRRDYRFAFHLIVFLNLPFGTAHGSSNAAVDQRTRGPLVRIEVTARAWAGGSVQNENVYRETYTGTVGDTGLIACDLVLDSSGVLGPPRFRIAAIRDIHRANVEFDGIVLVNENLVFGKSLPITTAEIGLQPIELTTTAACSGTVFTCRLLQSDEPTLPSILPPPEPGE